MSTSNIELTGHSGCTLRVRRVSGHLITIKTSKDVAYNERLQSQALKQKLYSDSIGKIPRIYREHINKLGLYEFYMEYIPGKTLAHHLHTLPLSQVENIALKLTETLCTKNTAPNSKVNKIFSQKIESLKKSLRANELPSATRSALSYLRKVDWTLCEESACHGDLTLENILLYNNEFYFIDFLDSFYNSWMIDAAKILQDIECFWSYRHEKSSENLYVRLLAIKNIFIASIEAKNNGPELLVVIYNLLLLNLLRILPYINDEATRTYLHKEIARLTRQIVKL